MSKTPLELYLERESQRQEEQEQFDSGEYEYQRLAREHGKSTPTAPKKPWTFQHLLIAIWVAIWIVCSIWVGYGNPKEDCFYAMFWGGFISFMIVMTLTGCIARIWLAWHTPEIIENIYRGLSSRK